MAPSCRSAALVVMLVLAALAVSAQAGQDVWVENKTPTKCKCNGVLIDVGLKVKITLDIDLKLLLEVLAEDGTWVEGSCHVPQGVTDLAIVLVAKATVALKITGVGGLLGGLLGALLGTVICLINGILGL